MSLEDHLKYYSEATGVESEINKKWEIERDFAQTLLLENNLIWRMEINKIVLLKTSLCMV